MPGELFVEYQLVAQKTNNAGTNSAANVLLIIFDGREFILANAAFRTFEIVGQIPAIALQIGIVTKAPFRLGPNHTVIKTKIPDYTS